MLEKRENKCMRDLWKEKRNACVVCEKYNLENFKITTLVRKVMGDFSYKITLQVWESISWC